MFIISMKHIICKEVSSMGLTSQNESVGRKLKLLRVARGFNQADVAGMLGVTQPHYSNIERGARQLSLRLLVKLCEALKVSPDEVLSSSGGSDEVEGERDEVV
jgi:transcriptional regulator with XRE-family HTH domain